GRQVGELQTVFSHGGFIENFPETENVGSRSSRALGRDVSFSTKICHCPWLALDLRDETNVCEFRRAVHKDDVGRLYVAMNQTMLMKELQRRAQLKCQVHAFAYRQLPALSNHGRHCLRGVGFGKDFLTLVLVVAEFHDVVETATWLAAAHMQYVDESRV